MNKTKTLGTIVAVMLATACGGSEPAAPPPATPTGAQTPSMPPAVATPAPTAETPVTAPAPAPKVATPQETTMALIDAWNAHDADKVAAAYSENGMLRIAPLPDLNGRSAIKAAAADAFKAFPDFKVATTRVTMKGNVAAVEWVITGTQTGDSDSMKLKATGRKIGLHGADMVTFDDAGLIKEAHRYFDMPTQMAQLDAKAKAGTFRPVEALPTGAPVVASVKGTPDEQKNLDAANVLYKAIDDHKVDGALAVTTTDSSMDDFTNPAPFKNQKAMKGFLESVLKAIPDVTQDKVVQMAAGDLVITEGYLHGTMKGNMGPMKATNKPIGMHFIDVMQMKDGKMVKGWSYGNSMEMAPPPAK
jgi:predicted ester cyclase